MVSFTGMSVSSSLETRFPNHRTVGTRRPEYSILSADIDAITGDFKGDSFVFIVFFLKHCVSLLLLFQDDVTALATTHSYPVG